MREYFSPLLHSLLRKTKYPNHLLSYKKYQSLQKETFYSLESKNKLWVKGQVRFIKKYFIKIPKTASILDIACGDGSGLKQFKKLGFKNVVGVEFNHPKAIRAKMVGYKIFEDDMHDLKSLNTNSFDCIYSSHTLEHAYNLKKAVKELVRILKRDGKLFVILPYPDRKLYTIKAHPAKIELGLDIQDKGKAVEKFFKENGFKVEEKTFDTYRDPEMWLTLCLKN
jgi:SAM-dependent methyltransferase